MFFLDRKPYSVPLLVLRSRRLGRYSAHRHTRTAEAYAVSTSSPTSDSKITFFPGLCEVRIRVVSNLFGILTPNCWFRLRPPVLNNCWRKISTSSLFFLFFFSDDRSLFSFSSIRAIKLAAYPRCCIGLRPSFESIKALKPASVFPLR